MNFSAAARAQLAGKNVRAVPLVEFLFASSAIRLYRGRRKTLTTLDGKVWTSDKNMGSMSTISQSYNGSAPAMQFTISGLNSEMVTKAKADRDEWLNRFVFVYYQFFQLPEDEAPWQPLDLPYPMTMVRMVTLTTRVEPAKKKGHHRIYSITVNAETPFATKRRPRFGYYTDRDQKLRYGADDRGLERTLGIDNKFIKFPVF